MTRYALLTGRAAPPGSVLVGAPHGMRSNWQNGHWTFRWPARDGLRRIAISLGYSAAAPTSDVTSAAHYVSDAEQVMLQHEIGHNFDAARWGHEFGRVPAWYDEATAMWMEPWRSRQHRLQQAQDGQATAPPLDSVFRFERPKVDPIRTNFSRWEFIGPCRGNCGRSWRTRFVVWRVRDDGTAASDTLYDEAAKASVPHADSVARYYEYSLAALYYIRARGGSSALHAVAARMGPSARGEDPLAGIAGIPPAGAAREADWRSWLRSAGAADP